MKSYTKIETLDGKRISKRLAQHWKHKVEIFEIEEEYKIMFPTAVIELKPNETFLEVFIKSDDEDHSHLENVVLSHINRMAQQEFDVTWQHL